MTRTEAINILQALLRYISVEEKVALDMAINSLKIDEMYDLEKENADEFISKSVLEDIKAEIEIKREYALEHDDRTFHNRETNTGYWVDGYYQCYKDILDIIDKHISGKEKE